MKRSGASGGFTLIELLVVIAIIALLVSILVPALSAAREIARKAYCQTSMKNMGVGLVMYENENKQVIPPVSFTVSSAGGWITQRWYDKIGPFVDSACRVNNTPLAKDIYVTIGVQPKSGNYARFWMDEVGISGVDVGCSRSFDCPSVPNRATKANPIAQEYFWNYAFHSQQWAWAREEDPPDLNNAAHIGNIAWVNRSYPLKVFDIPNVSGFCFAYDNDYQKQIDVYGSSNYANLSNFADVTNPDLTQANQASRAIAGMPHRKAMNMLMGDAHVSSCTDSELLQFIVTPVNARRTSNSYPWDRASPDAFIAR